MPRMKPRIRVRFLGRRRDAGGVAVIVGILLATGVLLGVSALAVDVGQLYAEREELQSGADAAAMAVAMDCVYSRVACQDQDLAYVTAKRYADLNARDGASHVSEVCGEDPAGWLPACSDDPANLTACLGQNPENTHSWVKVRLSTQRPGGSDDSHFLLPPIFARTLASGAAGSSVGACSRVAWGTPRTAFALTVCENIFNSYTSNGTDFAPPPPATPNARRYEKFFFMRPSRPYNGLCDEAVGGAGGWPLDSDFGWEKRDFACDVDMTHAVDDDTGSSDLSQPLPDDPSSTPKECYDELKAARESAEPVPVLVVRPAGGPVEVVGVAAFVVTGYRIQNQPDAPSTLGRHRRCGRDSTVTCVSGYFTTMVRSDLQVPYISDSPYGGFGVAPSLGASIVQTVG